MSRFKRLDDLNVLFVSLVKTPATAKQFILTKELGPSAWSAFVQKTRAEDPALAVRLDACVEDEDFARLRKAVEARAPELLDDYDEIVAQEFPWTLEEPSALDLRGLTVEKAASVMLYKRTWTSEMRQRHKERGGHFAGPGTSFPIKNCTDVHAAYMAAGRAKGNPARVRANVVRIARQMNLTRCLPMAAQPNQKGLRDMELTATEIELIKARRKKTCATVPPVEDDDTLDSGQTESDTQKARGKKKKPAYIEGMGMGGGDMGDQGSDEDVEDVEQYAEGMGMGDGGDEAEEVGGTRSKRTRRARKGVLGSIASLVARGAGYDVVSRDDMARIAKAMQLLKQTQGFGVSQRGRASDTTWPQAQSMDDAPAGGTYGMEDNRVPVPGRAPNDGTPWSFQLDGTTQKAMTQNPETLSGEAFDGSDTEVERTRGQEATRPAADSQVALGAPVTKADLVSIQNALDSIAKVLKQQDGRLGRVEMAKGISRITPAETATKSNGAGLWYGSAWDAAARVALF